jgi:hypothetical protein
MRSSGFSMTNFFGGVGGDHPSRLDPDRHVRVLAVCVREFLEQTLNRREVVDDLRLAVQVSSSEHEWPPIRQAACRSHVVVAPPLESAGGG